MPGTLTPPPTDLEKRHASPKLTCGRPALQRDFAGGRPSGPQHHLLQWSRLGSAGSAFVPPGSLGMASQRSIEIPFCRRSALCGPCESKRGAESASWRKPWSPRYVERLAPRWPCLGTNVLLAGASGLALRRHRGRRGRRSGSIVGDGPPMVFQCKGVRDCWKGPDVSHRAGR